MIIDCPECGRAVSDRAEACPGCGYPVRLGLEEARVEVTTREAVATRQQVGDVDCLACEARGFITLTEELHGEKGFVWCPLCGHSGRVILCHATDGYWAISQVQLERFLAGELHADAPGVDRLGDSAPEEHRYPEAGKRTDYEEIPDWFAKLLPKLIGREPPSTPPKGST